MIEIYCVGSGLKHHSLSYCSVVMMTPVEELRPVNFASTGVKTPLKWHN